MFCRVSGKHVIFLTLSSYCRHQFKLLLYQREAQEIQKRGRDIQAQINNLKNVEKKVKTARGKVDDAQKEFDNYDCETQKKDIIKKLMNGIKAQVTCLENAGSHYDGVMSSTYRLCGVKMNDSGVMEKARLLK